ncbi:MAG: tRNA epoxyqueuosine(34) reductase QueG, partial [Thiohalophilus sp.]
MIMSHHQYKQTATQSDWSALAGQIKNWGGQLGFQQTAITDTDLSEYEPRLQQWLAKQFH